jgi:dTDP-4-amino-4,6-dideoxygalactose transaminase
VPIPLNDLSRVYLRHQSSLDREILAVLRSGRWLKGERTAAFAKAFAAYIGVEYCIPVGNGSDALEIAMCALLGPARAAGGEVVTVANAGGYVTIACRRIGLIPVYVDIDEGTLQMDIDDAVASVGERTVAVVATHLFGKVVDVSALRTALDAAGHAGVPILEDCAQAQGARLGQRRVGSLGQVAAFSFFPTKCLGAFGDAGAITTSNPSIAERVERLHQYGWSAKYDVSIPGGQNSRMDEIQAAILSVLLPALDNANEERLRILQRYVDIGHPKLKFLNRAAGEVVYVAVVRTNERDSLRQHLATHDISTDTHFPILDTDQAAWRDLPYRIAASGLVVSRRNVGRILTVPCFAGMTSAEISQVCSVMAQWGIDQ